MRVLLILSLLVAFLAQPACNQRAKEASPETTKMAKRDTKSATDAKAIPKKKSQDGKKQIARDSDASPTKPHPPKPDEEDHPKTERTNEPKPKKPEPKEPELKEKKIVYPDDISDELPKYPGSESVKPILGSSNARWQVSYEVDAKCAEVAEYYRKELEERGWTIERFSAGDRRGRINAITDIYGLIAFLNADRKGVRIDLHVSPRK